MIKLKILGFSEFAEIIILKKVELSCINYPLEQNRSAKKSIFQVSFWGDCKDKEIHRFKKAHFPRFITND